MTAETVTTPPNASLSTWQPSMAGPPSPAPDVAQPSYGLTPHAGGRPKRKGVHFSEVRPRAGQAGMFAPTSAQARLHFLFIYSLLITVLPQGGNGEADEEARPTDPDTRDSAVRRQRPGVVSPALQS